MNSIASVSPAELVGRRKKLRQERRRKFVTTMWRILVLGGLTSGSIWAITLPGWLIRKPEQVVIVGNQFLSEQAIRSILPLSYPQSLLRLQPVAIANQLASQGPIASATVTRQLFPPGLTVKVQERHPVAIAQLITSDQSATNSPEVKLLDAQGIWISLEAYTSLEGKRGLPNLKIIGMRENYRPYWPGLYQVISSSPVKISEINWQDPANMILKTEIGLVHLGPYSTKFALQIKVLDRMRQLPQNINPDQIAYIDLKNPDLPPKIQIRPAHEAVKSNT